MLGICQNPFVFWRNPNGSRQNPFDPRRGTMEFSPVAMRVSLGINGIGKKETNFEWGHSGRVKGH
jgi:hypothetical protein